MSMTDPIADLITRIRNAQRNFFDTVDSPASKARIALLDVLKREGYIRSYSVHETSGPQSRINIQLKYDSGEPVIREIKRVSKPGRRVYSPIADLSPVKGGLGISILTTSKGFMSDSEARQDNVGGEVICEVF